MRQFESSFIKSAFIRILPILFICSSCALMVPPTGGPKDVTPPKVIAYSPDSAAVNFKAKKIKIEFDENIQLKDVKSQLVASPPLKHMPEVKAFGHMLTIILSDTLTENTTYTLNFGSSVADVNEGNVKDNFQYVFSTGPFIDSLTLKGKVKDAFDLTTQKGLLVVLYENKSDSAPYKQLPSYFAKTKDDGSFQINHIRKGSYRVFALKDLNSNYHYDNPDESIAFLDSTLEMQNNSQVDLFSFKEIPIKQFIRRSAAPESKHMQLIVNRRLTNLEITPLNYSPQHEKWFQTVYNKGKDTVDCWFPDFPQDSLRLVVKDNNKILDTVNLVFPSIKSKQKKFAFSLITSNASAQFDLNNTLRFKFNHPITTIDTSKITIYNKKKRVKFEAISDTMNPYLLALKVKWLQDTTYKIVLNPGAVNDIFNLHNDTIRTTLHTRELKYYGTMKLKIYLPDSSQTNNWIFQLMDEKGQVLKEIKDIHTQTTVYFEYLPPQKYQLKMIRDDNHDGSWTTGNYLKHQLPEKIYLHSGTLLLRSNWDLEQEWKVGEVPLEKPTPAKPPILPSKPEDHK